MQAPDGVVATDWPATIFMLITSNERWVESALRCQRSCGSLPGRTERRTIVGVGHPLTLDGLPLRLRGFGRGRSVHDAETHVFGVVDRLVDEFGDVVVEDSIDDVSAVTVTFDEAKVSQQSQLVRHRIEQRYSVGVVVTALALLAVPLMFGASFEPTLLRAMTFMIVTSPCAVVLATMPPLLAAIANAGRHGVLIKSAVALEALGTVDQIAFDKTGTLTHGIPQVTEIAVIRSQTTSNRWRTVAASIGRSTTSYDWPQQPSGPVSILSGAPSSTSHENATSMCQRPRSSPRRRDGWSARSSRATRCWSAHLSCSPVIAHRDSATTNHQSRTEGVHRHRRNRRRRDHRRDRPRRRVRSAAAAAVRSLTELTSSPPVLLPGDNTSAALRLAEQVHIADVRAELLPAEKAAVITGFKTEQRQVMFVGDGVNDAPAMATADVGVAMGRGGSDLTIQTADVILVRDDLTALATAIALARRAHRIVTANLAILATVITVLVLWDIVATLSLPLGVAGHEGSTIIVALNGLRLLRMSAWRPHVADEFVDRQTVPRLDRSCISHYPVALYLRVYAYS